MFLAAWIWAVTKPLLFAFGLFVLSLLYFVCLSLWADRATTGLNYFGQPLEKRRQFKRRIGLLGILNLPLLWILSRLSPVSLEVGSSKIQDVYAPKHSCPVEALEAAVSYEPEDADVFVATQMKSGTTWMLHLVYQILCRGKGDLVELGQALHAVVPWIESTKSVSMEQAQRVGEVNSKRIIKTHLPAALCPHSESAKYIYVVRHPVSCFASVVDFVGSSLGPLNLPTEAFEDWFCSEQMWFTSWPQHVLGWRRRAQEKPNVLLVKFEDMKKDLGNVTALITTFLGLEELDSEEMSLVLQKCSFTYMKANADTFEMNVPTVLQAAGTMFASGKADRDQDIEEETRIRIANWCGKTLEDDHGLDDLYPDLANSNHGDCP